MNNPVDVHIVTPAKAGVHRLGLKYFAEVMDARIRGNDGSLTCEVTT